MRSQFQQIDPDRFVIRYGGGFLLFVSGLPFVLMGVLSLLTSIGSLWSQGGRLMFGLVFVAVGGGLMFARSWTILDRSAGSILQQWGLLVPMRHTTLSLSSYDAVVINFKAGASDSDDLYLVNLRSRDASAMLFLVFSTGYAEASGQAKELATFLHLPLEDATSTHP